MKPPPNAVRGPGSNSEATAERVPTTSLTQSSAPARQNATAVESGVVLDLSHLVDERGMPDDADMRLEAAAVSVFDGQVVTVLLPGCNSVPLALADILADHFVGAARITILATRGEVAGVVARGLRRALARKSAGVR